jgi:hypothetical protein
MCDICFVVLLTVDYCVTRKIAYVFYCLNFFKMLSVLTEY